MRTININSAAMNIVGTASIPDAVCYVFNPNYIDINFDGYNDALIIAVEANSRTYDVEVSLFNGRAKCYISKLMQLHFEDYVSTRSLEMSISIKKKSGDLILTESTMALWASVDHGMKFGYYLPFVYDRAIYPKDVREVVWFKKFPFRVSLFRLYASNDVYGKSDSNATKAIIRNGILELEGDGGGMTGVFELSPITMFPETERQLVYTIIKSAPANEKFDAKFDITFNEMTSIAYIVKLIVCNDIDGIYLRWIDQYGFWQYFLFTEGKRTSKNKLSSIMVNAEYEKDGICHEAMRNIHIDNTDTLKCCAVNLRREILAYVETIYKSPHVEMYIGLDFEQNEMWKPVNIVAGSVDIEANQRLFDYEISITLPDTTSQTI